MIAFISIEYNITLRLNSVLLSGHSEGLYKVFVAKRTLKHASLPHLTKHVALAIYNNTLIHRSNTPFPCLAPITVSKTISSLVNPQQCQFLLLAVFHNRLCPLCRLFDDRSQPISLALCSATLPRSSPLTIGRHK